MTGGHPISRESEAEEHLEEELTKYCNSLNAAATNNSCGCEEPSNSTKLSYQDKPQRLSKAGLTLMTSSLAQIIELVEPPAEAIGLDRSWKEVEKDLGCVLPSDYKSFIDQYGSGLVCGLIAVWNFRDESLFDVPLKEVLCGARSVIESYKKENVLAAEAWTTFPEPGGLLPFCTVIDVHYLNWRTEGAAAEWDCVFWFADGIEFIHLKGDSFSDFLLKVLRKQYNRNEIPTFDEPYRFTDFSNW